MIAGRSMVAPFKVRVWSGDEIGKELLSACHDNTEKPHPKRGRGESNSIVFSEDQRRMYASGGGGAEAVACSMPGKKRVLRMARKKAMLRC